MENKENKVTIQLVTPLTIILFILFFLAKIFDKIDWSWWWVFSPLWIPLVFVLTILAILLMFVIIANVIGKVYDIIPSIKC